MPRSLSCADQVADIADGDRIDAGQGLVEQHEGGMRGQRPRDLDAAPFAARQGQRRRAPQVGDGEFGQQILERRLAPFAVRIGHLENRANIVFDRQAAEDRGLLRQVADPQPGAAIHGQAGDIVVVQQHAAFVRARSGR